MGSHPAARRPCWQPICVTIKLTGRDGVSLVMMVGADLIPEGASKVCFLIYSRNLDAKLIESVKSTERFQHFFLLDYFIHYPIQHRLL